MVQVAVMGHGVVGQRCRSFNKPRQKCMQKSKGRNQYQVYS